MKIHVRIAVTENFQTDVRMDGEQFQHMVEKADACVYFVRARAVEIEFQNDFRFFGFTRNFRCSHAIFPPNARGRHLRARAVPRFPRDERCPRRPL